MVPGPYPAKLFPTETKRGFVDPYVDRIRAVQSFNRKVGSTNS